MRCQTITLSIFGAQKWYTPIWNSQSKAFGVNMKSLAHLNLLSTPKSPPSDHLGGCNPSAEKPGNDQIDVHLKLLLQYSICIWMSVLWSWGTATNKNIVTLSKLCHVLPSVYTAQILLYYFRSIKAVNANWWGKCFPHLLVRKTFSSPVAIRVLILKYFGYTNSHMDFCAQLCGYPYWNNIFKQKVCL